MCASPRIGLRTHLSTRRESSPEVHDGKHIGKRLAVREVGREGKGIVEELVLLGLGICVAQT